MSLFFLSTQYEVKKNWLLYHLKLLLQVQINRKKQIKEKKKKTQTPRLTTTQWRTSFEEKSRRNFDYNDQTKQPKKIQNGYAWRNRPSTLTAKTICDLRQEVCAYSTALTKHTSQRCSKPSLSSPHFHSTGVRSGLLSASLTFFLFLLFRSVHLVPASVLTPAFALFLYFLLSLFYYYFLEAGFFFFFLVSVLFLFVFLIRKRSRHLIKTKCTCA